MATGGSTTRWLRQLVQERRLAFHKPHSGQVTIDLDDLDAFVERREFEKVAHGSGTRRLRPRKLPQVAQDQKALGMRGLAVFGRKWLHPDFCYQQTRRISTFDWFSLPDPA